MHLKAKVQKPIFEIQGRANFFKSLLRCLTASCQCADYIAILIGKKYSV